MDSWIWQGGYPLVRAALAPDGRSVTLSQRRFLFAGDDDGTRWAVPVHVRQRAGDRARTSRSSSSTATRSPCALLAPDALGGRERRRQRLLPRRVRRRPARPPGRLGAGHPVDGRALQPGRRRLGQRGGRSPAGRGLRPVRAGLRRRARPVRSGRSCSTGWAGSTASSRATPASASRATCGPSWRPPSNASAGSRPPGEDDLTGELRGTLIRALGNARAATPPPSSRPARCTPGALADPSSVPPAVAAAALSVVSANGGDADYEAGLARYRASHHPQDQRRELLALAEFRDAALFERTLALALTDDVRTQDAPMLLGRCIAHRDHGARAWRFVREHWDEANARFPSNLIDPHRRAGAPRSPGPQEQADVAGLPRRAPAPAGGQAGGAGPRTPGGERGAARARGTGARLRVPVGVRWMRVFAVEPTAVQLDWPSLRGRRPRGDRRRPHGHGDG